MTLSGPWRYLCEQDAVKQQLRLGLILGDVRVRIHAENLRRRVEGKRLGELQVAVVLRQKRRRGGGREVRHF